MAATKFRDTVLGLVRMNPKDGEDRERDLSLRQLGVLILCDEAARAKKPVPQTVRGLAEALNVSKPPITRALDRLENLGLVARVADTTDRRSINIAMTETGTAYLKNL